MTLSRYTCLLVVLLVFLVVNSVDADTISFGGPPFNVVDWRGGSNDAFVGSSYTAGDLTVTASATVIKLENNGLGVIGGGTFLLDSSVNGSESLVFTFSHPAFNVTYHLLSANATNEHEVEAFSEGVSLGALDLDNSYKAENSAEAWVPLSFLYGDVPIDSFTVQPTSDDPFRVGWISYTQSSVPEPGALSLLAIGALSLHRWRRSRRSSRAHSSPSA
jgi:hypothetical protein